MSPWQAPPAALAPNPTHRASQVAHWVMHPVMGTRGGTAALVGIGLRCACAAVPIVMDAARPGRIPKLMSNDGPGVARAL